MVEDIKIDCTELEFNRCYNMDCLNFMKHIPNNFFIFFIFHNHKKSKFEGGQKMGTNLVICPKCGEGMDIVRIDNKEIVCGRCYSKVNLDEK